MAEINDTSAGQIKPGNADGSNEIGQINAQLKAMNEQFTQALQTISSKLAEKGDPMVQTITDEPVPDTFLDLKPQEFEKRIEQRVDQLITQREGQALKKNQTLAQLAAEYPEATDPSNPLYKKVLEVHNNLPKSMQDSAEGYELAVSKAALQMGIAPKSTRKDVVNNDSFLMNGSGASGNPTKNKKVELSGELLATAKLMGLDINNPQQVERLKERAQRQTWGRYK